MEWSLNGKDILAFIIIILISYWISFKSSLIDIVFPIQKKVEKGPRHRGTITGKSKELSNEPIFKKFDVLVIYRRGSKLCTTLANDFSKLCSLQSELLNIEDGCDFEVFENIEIPIVFILDSSVSLHEFITKKETDSNGVRAYQRRHLSNLRFAVIKTEDAAFSQFIDEGLEQIGGKRILNRLEDEKEIQKWIENFISKIK